MALQAFEGFENLSATDLATLRGWAPNLGFGTTPSFSTGRFGGSAVQLDTGVISPASSTGSLCRVLTGAPTNIFMGAAINPTSLSNSNILLGCTGAAGGIIAIEVSIGGAIRLVDSDDLQLAVTANGLIVVGTWSYIEVRVDIVLGLVQVRQDGVQVLTFSGSIANGNASIELAGLGYPDTFGSSGRRFPRGDDLYVCDSLGAQNNNFLGNVRVIQLPRTADASVQLTPSGVGGNFAQVDDSPSQNGDTDYVSTGLAGNRDRYSSSTAVAGNPLNFYGVGTRMWLRGTGAQNRVARNVLRSGIFDSNGADVAPGASYVGYDDYFQADPATGGTWKLESIRAAQVGPQLVS